MNISHDNYQVEFNKDQAAIVCRGSFRLHGDEYAPVFDLLIAAADHKPEHLKLDLTELQFLNSSGINTLSKFILHVRKLGASKVLVLGTSKYPWQEKSLKNLTRLLPSLEIEIV